MEVINIENDKVYFEVNHKQEENGGPLNYEMNFQTINILIKKHKMQKI